MIAFRYLAPTALAALLAVAAPAAADGLALGDFNFARATGGLTFRF